MNLSINTTANLHNDVPMPLFGLGVFKSKEGSEVETAVQWALEAGYRSIDTAALYGNETGVGRAIRACSIPRSDIFVTSKVWNSDQGYDQTLRAFDTSIEKLGFEYLDLYLVHWPVKGEYKETWRALEAIYRSGRVKAIGVSNFLINHLDDLLQSADVVPMVNQFEFHPYLQTPALVSYCKAHQIVVEAWSPIMKGRVMQVPELVQLGEKYGKTAVQVTLRWMLQRGIVTIPKSVKQARIQSNADIYDFELTEAEIALINGLDRGERIGPDPANFNF
ncbi:MAG: aldo/keto reductase [Anaerolineales bacterium]|nr:aldo/keto reductase [Anaerolineales bacterium]